jgi:hypothetical protein
MGALDEKRLDQFGRGGADGSRTLHDLRIGIGAVMRWHVRRIGDEAPVGNHPSEQRNQLMTQHDLDMHLGQSDLYDLPCMHIRDAVMLALRVTGNADKCDVPRPAGYCASRRAFGMRRVQHLQILSTRLITR